MNTRYKKYSLLAISILFMFGTFNIGTTLAGFGISPPTIKENNLVPGSHFEKTIYLVQGNPTEDLDMKAEIDSPNMADWINFESGDQFTIPTGVQQFPFKVTIDVPKDADFGIYKAFIRINTKPKTAKEDNQVSIAIGGRVDVEMTIGDNIVYEYTVNNIKIIDVEEGKNPKVLVSIKNTGNVPAMPSGASFELFNKYGNIRLAYAENDNFEETKPFGERTFEMEFPIDVKLAVGEYWGHVKIYGENGSVNREMRTVFNVTEKSLIKKMIIPAGGILLLLIIFIFLKRKITRLLKR